MAQNRQGLGKILGGLTGGAVGGLAGIPAGPAGIVAGAGLGYSAGSGIGNYAQNRANVNNPNYPNAQNPNANILPGVPVTTPGSANSPSITSQNLGDNGNALFFNRFNPSQASLIDFLGNYGKQGLQNNNFSFSPIEEQARLGFAQRTLPSIAERFSGLGAQRSSAFGQTLGEAGAGLESDLASMKQGYNLQQQGILQNLLGLGLAPQFESIYSPKGPTFGQSFGTAAASASGPIIAAIIQALSQKYGQQQ